jgi:diguanylate cyclase (GGDEF)-like protein
MQPPAQTFSVLSFLGVIIQLGGALMLVTLFVMLRRFVLRRAYFAAWATAWGALAVAIASLVVRYILVPDVAGRALTEEHPVVRLLYFIYQMAKGVGFVFFLRGTVMYVAGTGSGLVATRRLWAAAAVFAIVSTLASRNGLNEMVVWQCAIAVPALGYCASALLWLPAPRRTVGSVAAGVCFMLIAILWLFYGVAFPMVIAGVGGRAGSVMRTVVSLNSYFDLGLNVLLGYAMILVLMEDAKREVDDAQAELRVTHDQLRRAALYDPLTDSMNRRAFTEGVGLDMVRATFGTVVLADLDNLKIVNDRFGHAAGDQLIRRCADVLRGTLRSYDKLYRWGGDEFLLIVPSARAADVLNRLQRSLDAVDIVATGTPGEAVRLAVSLGAADYASSSELAAAMERADRAMYAEKSRRKTDPRSVAGEYTYSPPASLPTVR